MRKTNERGNLPAVSPGKLFPKWDPSSVPWHCSCPWGNPPMSRTNPQALRNTPPCPVPPASRPEPDAAWSSGSRDHSSLLAWRLLLLPEPLDDSKRQQSSLSSHWSVFSGTTDWVRAEFTVFDHGKKFITLGNPVYTQTLLKHNIYTYHVILFLPMLLTSNLFKMLVSIH